MDYLVLLEVGMAYMLGIMSPGPSVSLIMHNTLMYSKRAGFITSLGIILGIAVQAGAVLLGMSFVAHNSPVFILLKRACACYLAYIGLRIVYKALISKKNEEDKVLSNPHSCFRDAILIECLNPIAMTFFLGIFSVFTLSSPTTRLICWLEIILLGTLWFNAIVIMLSFKPVLQLFQKLGKILEIAMALVFVVLGYKMF